jgi:crossover junction endodeoxyribonuclease RuvC
MIILGIDPGTATIGYGLLKTDKSRTNRSFDVLDFGCITTSPKENTAKRLDKLHKELTKLIKKYAPDTIAVEELFFFKNIKTAIKVSQARGVILLNAQQNRLAIHEYTPLQVKQAITGYGLAQKQQVQQMVKSILGLAEIPKPDDAADALAIAICCAHSCRLENKIRT